MLILGALGCSPGDVQPVVTEGSFVPGDLTGTGDVVFRAQPRSWVTVRYGLEGDRVRVTDPVPAELGVVRLSGLAAGRVYAFEVVSERSGLRRRHRFEAEVPPAFDAPPVTVEDPPPDDPADDPTCGPGRLLVAWDRGSLSGASMFDRRGDVVWSVTSPDPEEVAFRARFASDGTVLWATRVRDVEVGRTGHLFRDAADGTVHTETELLDPHHDFVELPPGDDGVARFAWLAWYATQPSDGATLTRLLTDRIYTAPEGALRDEAERAFATLGDYSHGAYTQPRDGLDAYPGFNEFAGGASLAWNDRDGEFLLMWRWIDAALRIDGATGEVLGQWGDRYATYRGQDSFQRAAFSDLALGAAPGEDHLLVFDDRDRDASRLVEYRFGTDTFEPVWDLPLPGREAGVADVRRIAGCDHLLVTRPAAGLVLEIDRDGTPVWSLSLDATFERAELVLDEGAVGEGRAVR